jgi:hypothetical protein
MSEVKQRRRSRRRHRVDKQERMQRWRGHLANVAFALLSLVMAAVIFLFGPIMTMIK